MKVKVQARGFTLIELLVALVIMATLSIMAWRGLDVLVNSREQAREIDSSVSGWNAALTQWRLDLERLDGAAESAAFWLSNSVAPAAVTRVQEGIVLSLRTSDGMRVVAWGLRPDERGILRWTRWVSAPLLTLQQWRQAIDAAAQALTQSSSDIGGERVQTVAARAMQLEVYGEQGWAAMAPGAQLQQAPHGLRLTLVVEKDEAVGTGNMVATWVSPKVRGSAS